MKNLKYLLIAVLFFVGAKTSLAFDYFQGYATCAYDQSCYMGWYGGCVVESGGQAGGCSNTGSVAVCGALGMFPGCSAWCDGSYTANPNDPLRDLTKPGIPVVCACCKNFEICYPKIVPPPDEPRGTCDFSIRNNYCTGTFYKDSLGAYLCPGYKTCPGGTCIDSGTDAPDSCSCDDGSICTDDAYDAVTNTCTHTFDSTNSPACVSPPICGCPDPSEVCGAFQSYWTSEGVGGCQPPIWCPAGTLTCDPTCQECDDASGKCIELPAIQCSEPAEPCPTGCVDYDTSVPDGLGGLTFCPANCQNQCVAGVCVGNTPSLESLLVKNESGIVVGAQDGKNHICQTIFTNRKVIFEVQGFDGDGLNTISNIDLRLGTNVYNSTSLVNGLAIFNVIFPSVNWDIYSIEINVTDNTGLTTGWVDTLRDFRNWNCNVAISGTFYDGSVTGLVCPDTGYTDLANKDVLNLTSLVFKSTVDANMTINFNGISYGSNNLTWGLNYVPQLNADIALNNPRMKSKSSTAVNPDCDWNIDTTKADPYVNNPSFVADFSGTINQMAWWRAENGGVMSNNQIDGAVPNTCLTNCELSIGGLVAGANINNVGKALASFVSPLYYGSLVDVNTNYNYFYDLYFVRNGIGTTLIGDQTIDKIGASGIYFIKQGNLTINAPKTVVAGDFLMIIVDGNINVDSTVNRVDGILVANNITASVGQNDTQLVFNGSLFAADTVNFSGREYLTPSKNNTLPSVVVRHNPQLLFNIPGEVAKVLINWQWGN